MSIKNLKPRSRSRYKQGYYKLLNPKKYHGDGSKIIYRSGYELQFCKWCDLNPNIIKWSSEPFYIDYYTTLDSKKHKYYIDFYIEIQMQDSVKKMLIEVKPGTKLKPPKKPKRKTKKSQKNYNYLLKEFHVNECKFKTAKKFAQTMGAEFKIVTESFLKNIR